MKLILPAEVFISPHGCISTSCYPFFGVFIVLTIKLGGKFKAGGGSDGYLVNQPRLSEVKGYKQSLPSLNSGECNERNERRYKGFKRIGMHLMPMMGEEKGGVPEHQA